MTLILGRDGMGDSTEADYDSWVSYVCAHIDEASGHNVTVEERGTRDVQSDDVRGDAEDVIEAVRDAKWRLWEQWCAEGAPVS